MRSGAVQESESDALREEVETLAAFLHLVQREYAQLQRDFAAVLRASGGSVTATAADFAVPMASAITHTDNADGTTTFRVTAGSAEY